MRLYVTAVIALALLGGCTTSQFSPSGDSHAAPTSADDVQLLERLPAAGSYELLGVIIVRGVRLSSDERMFEQLKERAAQRGADAVVPQGKIRDQETTDGSETRRLGGYAIRRN